MMALPKNVIVIGEAESRLLLGPTAILCPLQVRADIGGHAFSIHPVDGIRSPDPFAAVSACCSSDPRRFDADW